jgi:PAS domain S-box-containing protein
MTDSKKTKAELLLELETLRARNRVLEKLSANNKTSRLAAEEARAYAESIVNTVRQPLLVLDADLHILTANRFFYKSFAVSKEETENRLIYEIGDRQWDIPMLRYLFENILPEHTHFHGFDVEQEFPNIGRRTMLLNARQIYSHDIGQDLILLAIEDITERKRAEEALRVSNRLLHITNRHAEMKSLLNAFADEVKRFTGCEAVGIRILDYEGNIPYESHAGFTKSFYKSENPLSVNLDECMCINVIKGEIDSKLPFYTEGGSFYMNGTTRFLATVPEEEKGKTRNVCNEAGYESVALIPIRVNHSILGLMHVADTRENMVPLWIVETLEAAAMQLGTGIERVSMQQSLKESEGRYRILSENLEVAVKKKIEELRQSESLASIGQMVSVVAHDIRNPLHIIQMGIEAIRKELSEDKKKSEILEEIDYGLDSLNDIVSELLEYARPVSMEYVSWPVRDVVDRALNTLRDRFGKIRVHLELDEGEKEIRLDGAKMIRVLSNLISNATDAMPKGGDLRILSRFFELETGKVLRLSISDNGHGIDEEDLKRIHEPFVTTKPQGTGLGIPICKKIIAAHNGSFRIDSKVNEGTIIDIELPVGDS